MDKTAGQILIIEDEPGMRSFLVDALEGADLSVDEADNGNAGLAAARKKDYDLVLTDLKMPGLSGLDLVKALRGLEDPPEVVVLTAYGTVSDAVEAMKSGALDFMEKPVSGPDQVRIVVARGIQRRRLVLENERLRSVSAGSGPFEVADQLMKDVLAGLGRVAPTDSTVLILGESGSGKEVVARELHRLRFGDGAPFVVLNCAAMPENLLESELFGHEKGAFTGAVSRKLGVVETASGGTLFLDEVGEMPASLQPKLLRVLETREFQRLGGIRTLSTDARFVAATNRDLESAVKSGLFREDLFYRLNVFPVTVPPLRERPDDVEALARYFLAGFAVRQAMNTPALERGALTALQMYDWPGNVRELRNIMERAAILCDDGVIHAGDLGLPTGPRDPGLDEGVLAVKEKETILQVLDKVDGNRRLAADRLGISLRTLQYRLKQYGLIGDKVQFLHLVVQQLHRRSFIVYR